MPQIKFGLYHRFREVRAVVYSIIFTLTFRQPPLELIARDGQLLDHQFEGTSAAQGNNSSGSADPSPSFSSFVERPWSLASAELHSIPIPKQGTTQRRLTGMLKTSQKQRENSIGLHSQNVAGFTKYLGRCAEWFGHFRQRESRGAIDLVLLQETRVAVGEAARLNKLYNTTWGFVDTPGRTRWTDSDAARGVVAILLNPYSSNSEMEP